MMMMHILNTVRDSDDWHSASTTVATAASNSRLLKLVEDATAIRCAGRC